MLGRQGCWAGKGENVLTDLGRQVLIAAVNGERARFSWRRRSEQRIEHGENSVAGDGVHEATAVPREELKVARVGDLVAVDVNQYERGHGTDHRGRSIFLHGCPCANFDELDRCRNGSLEAVGRGDIRLQDDQDIVDPKF